VSFNLVESPYMFVNGELSGSACCVWVDGAGRTYVLSAAHVIDRVPGHTPIEWLTLDGNTGGGQTLEPTDSWIAVPGGELDAGLVEIGNTPGPFGNGGSYPWASSVVTWDEITVGRSVVICGKSRPIFATVANPIPFPPGEFFSNHTHGRLLRLAYDSHETAPGDSGGAVISLPEGKLLGMHVGIDPTQKYAWAVAAADVEEILSVPFPGLSLRP
jgi:hypothetical protein